MCWTTYIIIAVIVAVLILLIWKSFDTGNSTKTRSMIRFYRPTCPWCVKTQKDWDLFKSNAPKYVNVIEYNVSEGNHSNILASYGGQTVPFIVKVDESGRFTVYEGDRSAQDLLAWSAS